MENSFEETINSLHRKYIEGQFPSVADCLEYHLRDYNLKTLRSSVKIKSSDEPLSEIESTLRLPTPHPYEALGAPYSSHSPWFLRSSVLERLKTAQGLLVRRNPNYRLAVFDAYRPYSVQNFMVTHARDQIVKDSGYDSFDSLDDKRKAAVMDKVYSLWAMPSRNPDSPSPHSTGSAVDLTILTQTGEPLNMGSEIDAYPPLCYPSYFESARTELEGEYHKNRRLLQEVMESAGFCRLPNEWWHFSYGDQQWAMQAMIASNSTSIAALYGATGEST